MEGKDMIGTIVALVVGLAVLCGGVYYFIKEKNDRESRKIYGVVTAAGAVIIAFVVVRILVAGF